MDADVVVIGAGAAGLCAARKLRALGIGAFVVEARTRLGGRIHTISDPRFSFAHRARCRVSSRQRDPRDLSAAEFARGGGPGESLGRVINGYGRLVDWLAAGIGERARLVTGAVVEHIEWKRGSVRVHARSTATGGVRRLHARRAIVTLPLGVLAAPRGTPGTPVFEPEPPTQLAAARSLGSGSVVRGVLRFRDAFWEDGVRHLETDAAETETPIHK